MRKQVLKAAWGLVLSLVLAAWLALGGDLGANAGAGEAPRATVPEEAAGAPGAAEATPEAPRRRMAITFDDLPAGSVLQPGTAGQAEILVPIREAVTARDIPAIGFVNESKLHRGEDPEPQRVALLADWLDAGLALGNHTFSHPDLHRVELEPWLEDAARGEVVTRRLLAERGAELKWFRHPFLHTGRSLETKRAVQEFLAERGQRVAPVTVDNDDYLFAAAWDRAAERGDGEMQRRVEEAYVPYMVDKVAYYEEQSRRLFGREIPLVLLLHANSINARRFGDLADALEQRGYGFVPLEEAVADPAYDSPDTYTGPAGISWLHRWALTREVDRSLFEGEPDVPDWLRAAAAREPR